MMCAGRYLTAKISEYPNHENECILSDILEDNVPEKYYLSRKQAEKLLYKEKPTQGERIYSSKGLSDSRLYKMSGNAVTVNVISAIGQIIKKVNDKN
jgi:site-specific DNA-cytosine methylase